MHLAIIKGRFSRVPAGCLPEVELGFPWVVRSVLGYGILTWFLDSYSQTAIESLDLPIGELKCRAFGSAYLADIRS